MEENSHAGQFKAWHEQLNEGTSPVNTNGVLQGRSGSTAYPCRGGGGWEGSGGQQQGLVRMGIVLKRSRDVKLGMYAMHGSQWT
jgi:hypothetical protein